MPVGISCGSDRFARIDGRRAVVTGAASGIGQAIAVELARAGAASLVIATARNESGLDDTAAQIASISPECAVARFVGDLAERTVRTKLLSQATVDQAIPHIWINNAGLDVLTGEAAAWTFEEKLARLWAVDVVATIDLSRRVGQAMQSARRDTADPGREAAIGSDDRTQPTTPFALLTIGWDQAEQGQAGDAGQLFGAIKGAVIGFTRSLAKSLAPEVRVACLAPGWIRTKWAETAASDAWKARAARESLAGRFGTPEEVASVARFVVSEAGAYVSGNVIAVNGGLAWGADRIGD